MHRREVLFLAATASTMACLHLVHFGLPPLQPDETSLQFMALPLLGEPSGAYEAYAKSLGDSPYLGPFPVFYGQYIGVLGGYASLPFQWALGPSTDAIRAYSAFVAILIQASLYLATREFFSRRAAAAATALFTAFPLVVFYSRQSTTYDWIILALCLLVLYFGMRFFNGRGLWNLCVAALLAGIAVWAYLFALWFVLGILVMMPVCAAAARSRRVTRLGLAAVSAAAACGAVPLMLQHAMSPHASPGALLLSTVSGTSASLASDNLDLAGNLLVRLGHLYGMLSYPHHGLQFAALEFGWHPFEPAFLVLFAASAAAGAVWVARRWEGRRRVMGLLVMLSVMLFASTFTVSHVSILQLGIMLPVIFVLIGGGLDRIVAWLCGYGRAVRRLGRDRILAGIIVAAAASQAPVIADGYSQLASEPHAQYMHAVGGLDSYLSDTGLIPVEMDFWTRSMFFMMDGKHVPVKARIGADISTGFDQDSREAVLDAEDLGLVRTDVAFVIYTYPEALDCSADMDASTIHMSNQCLQAYFVESAAGRNGLDVSVRDFDLPDGTPYYRALQMVPRPAGT